MVYDYRVDGIVRVSFPIHGKVLAAFEIPSTCAMATVALDGRGLDDRPTSARCTKFSMAGQHDYQDGPRWHSPSKRDLYFVEDPATRRREHLAIFIEWGTHECWPNSTGSCTTSPPHNGKGYSFLPDTVTVLSAANDAPFIYYGGKLGDPTSIMRHRSWLIDEAGLHIPDDRRTDRNPYQKLGALRWPPALSGQAGTNRPVPQSSPHGGEPDDHPVPGHQVP